MSSIIKSKIDGSANYVTKEAIGYVEARFVRRVPDYFSVYLSSQTGCNRGCRFCHLTTTKQTKFIDLDANEILDQAEKILAHYHDLLAHNGIPAKQVHFNFMARGEPLHNKHILTQGTSLLMRLGMLAFNAGLHPKFNVSTILPDDMANMRLIDVFPIVTPTIYYSIYSINQQWRNKWLPTAKNVYEALDDLALYQYTTKKIIKFHCAFIKDENDNLDDVQMMMRAIKVRGIFGEFNIVRYNPYSPEYGEETSDTQLNRIAGLIREYMPVKFIPRVDPKTYGSCGMFVEKTFA